MRLALKSAVFAASLLMTGAAFAAEPARPQFAQGSMNVYRRFPVEQRAKMVEFYEKVLGLQPLTPINLGGGQQMILFKVGSGQIKLAAGLKEDRKYHLGEVKEATGIRLYTLSFADEAALSARFTANGYPAPAFKDIGGGRRAALVKDPAGFNLELVIAPGAPAGVTVGIAVSDLARSRAFYRDFANLEELAPVKDPLLGVTKYPYRHGETTIELWSAGKGLPADTGSAGIQYVTSNVEAIDAAAKAQNVTVETPLGGVAGFNIITVWLNDPDGVTNYFYQLGPRPQAAK
jgi:catechol 2,3-dioxygenase-like lactoylglutathione lyase family enzyme